MLINKGILFLGVSVSNSATWDFVRNSYISKCLFSATLEGAVYSHKICAVPKPLIVAVNVCQNVTKQLEITITTNNTVSKRDKRPLLGVYH